MTVELTVEFVEAVDRLIQALSACATAAAEPLQPAFRFAPKGLYFVASIWTSGLVERLAGNDDARVLLGRLSAHSQIEPWSVRMLEHAAEQLGYPSERMPLEHFARTHPFIRAAGQA